MTLDQLRDNEIIEVIEDKPIIEIVSEKEMKQLKLKKAYSSYVNKAIGAVFHK